MYRILVIILVCASVLQSCTTPPENQSVPVKKERTADQIDTISVADTNVDTITPSAKSIPKVLIVPCSNGYLYNSYLGDANPALVEHLGQDERIEVLPFPYVEMQGSGYQGVYDKKYCTAIIERTDADFLIMTRMTGGLEHLLRHDSTEVENQNWGFSTKILNTKTMEQFNGVSASKLPKFEDLDSSVKKKTSTLVDLILASHNTP